MVVNSSINTNSAPNQFPSSASSSLLPKDYESFHNNGSQGIFSSATYLNPPFSYPDIQPITELEKISNSLIKADIIAKKVSRGDKIKNYRTAKYRSASKNSSPPAQLQTDKSVIELAENAKENARQLILSLGAESKVLPDYKQYIKDVEDSLKIIDKNMTFPKIRAMWNSSEDHLLTLGVSLYGANTESWPKIAVLVPGRTNKACRKRWFHSLDPTLHKGSWSVEEDNLLRLWVSKHPGQWSKIAKRIQGRTDDQCAKRWRESLDPNISRAKWSPEEDARLLEKYNEYGAQWQKIAVFFQGRPGLHCRNRWRKIQRRSNQDPLKSDPGLDKPDSNNFQPEQFFSKPINTSLEQNHIQPSTYNPPLIPSNLSEQNLMNHLDQKNKKIFRDSPVSTLSYPSFKIHELDTINNLSPNLSNHNHNNSFTKNTFIQNNTFNLNKNKDKRSFSNPFSADPNIGSFSIQLQNTNINDNNFDSNANTNFKRLKQNSPPDLFLSQVNIQQLATPKFNLIDSSNPEIHPDCMTLFGSNQNSLNYNYNDLNIQRDTLHASNISKKQPRQKLSKKNKKSDYNTPTPHQKEWLYSSAIKPYGCAALPGICDSSFYDSLELLEHLKAAHNIFNADLDTETDHEAMNNSKWNHIFRCGISGCSSLYKNVRSLENHIYNSNKSLHYQNYIKELNSNQNLNNPIIFNNCENHMNLLEDVNSIVNNTLDSSNCNLGPTDCLLQTNNFSNVPPEHFNQNANCMRSLNVNSENQIFSNYYLKGHDFIKNNSDQKSELPNARPFTKSFFDNSIDSYTELNSPIINSKVNSSPTKINYNTNTNLFSNASSNSSMINLNSRFFDNHDINKTPQFDFSSYETKFSHVHQDDTKLIQTACGMFNNQNN
ncbi:hypothetical protein BB561_002246 [Smittium simulii]|uniref:Uncharacterized protein n=1 Tax=Smittium simulii TaxID=133385 RepID=A0A2T9YR66_9FUNG|nr:hypothetical protein BB561_002246 [Smittium simulii]